MLCCCLFHCLIASLVNVSGVVIGGDILAVLLSLSSDCFFGECIRCGNRGRYLAVMLSLSLFDCFFGECIRCGNRGRYPCCAVVSFTV